MSAPIQIEPVEGGVLSLRIATDEEPFLDADVVPRLGEAVGEIAGREDIRAVVVEGGSRRFSSGAARGALVGADARDALAHFCAEVPRLLLGIPVPTVAAMVGHAVGGGLVIGLWCDVAYLAEESLYGANFMQLGFSPGMGSTVLLEEALGAPLARELMLTGRLVKGRELKEGGGPLAHAVVPRSEVRARAVATARDIAEAPRGSLVLLKGELARRRRARLEEALGAERAMHAVLFGRDEVKARIAEEYGGGADGGEG